MNNLIGFAGYSNSGKTTVIAALIKIFRGRGYKVAAIKHAPHGYDMDVPGKDSWLHYNSGADAVAVIGPCSITTHKRYANPSLSEAISQIGTVDLILVEGFKNEIPSKILVYRHEDPCDAEYPEGDYEAVVSNIALPLAAPCFLFSELEKLADYIMEFTGLGSLQQPEQ